jgi:LEA14-like dessication related protein
MRIMTGEGESTDEIRVECEGEETIDLFVNGRVHRMSTAQADALALMLQAASCVVGARSR